jgi:hypothetical protein
VPLPPFRLAAQGEDFVVAGHEPGLTGECVALMQAMLELYNLTHKLARHRSTSPWPLIASDLELARRIWSVQGPDGSAVRRDLVVHGTPDEVAVHSFFHSRRLGYRPDQGFPAFPVLMPVLDAMNHHAAGANYNMASSDGEGGSAGPALTIIRSPPLPEAGDEAFACYGLHDRFETWIGYGFIDASARFVRSTAARIALPGLGTIETALHIEPRPPAELPPSVADLGFYVPKVLGRGPGLFRVAALPIPGPQAPRALRRTLRLLITEMARGRPGRADLVMLAEEQIVAANLAYFRDLAAFLRAMPLADPRYVPIRDNFVRVCEIQAAMVEDYTSYARD